MNAHNEQHDSASPVVKQNLTTQPAAAQEAGTVEIIGRTYLVRDVKAALAKAGYVAPAPAAQEAVAWQRRYIGATRRNRPVEWHTITKDEFVATKAGKWADRYEVRAIYAAPATAAPGIDPDAVERLRNLAAYAGAAGCPSMGGDIKALLDALDASPKGDLHADDLAVDAFAAAMKAKLADARAKGRGGWQGDEPGMQQRLSDMLRAHVEKGDPRDVANFCMFLHQRGEGISPKGGSEAAWDDCKVAFGFDGDEEAIWDAWKRGQLSLPSGWSLNETDGAGARMVAVFRVDGIPAPKDGETVRELLNMLAQAQAQAGDAEVQP